MNILVEEALTNSLNEAGELPWGIKSKIAKEIGLDEKAIRVVANDMGLQTARGKQFLGIAKVQKGKAEYAPPSVEKPGLTLTPTGGKIVHTSSTPIVTNEDWLPAFKHWELDPTKYEVVGNSMRVNVWEMGDGEGGKQKMFQYRADLRLIGDSDDAKDREDIDAILNSFKDFKTPKLPKHRVDVGIDNAFIVALADWQIGKKDGDGVIGTVEALKASFVAVRDRALELQKTMRLETLVISTMGDMSEGCESNYATQAFTVELNQREQNRITRRLLIAAITTLAPYFKKVIVTGVPGNHGENRGAAGKVFTTPGDNRDVEILEIAQEVISAQDGFKHVEFIIPNEELIVVLDTCGKRLAFTHMHQVKGSGGDPQAKAKKWWTQQSFAGTPVGSADILVSAHFHHLSYIDHGPKIQIQCPAMDGGSEWFRELTGTRSASGTLTFTVNTDGPDNLKVV